ncbi:Uncharacterised protein [uncultured archaeon]|nr:Uncharacterised protein [uncultured archaeon]
MGERFRKAILTASAAAAISLFSDVSWAKPRVRAERIIIPIADAPSHACRKDFESDIASRMAKPRMVGELLNIISEKGLHYNWNFVRMRKEVDDYLRMSARFKRREDTLLKLTGEIEGTYRTSVHDTIMAYAKDSDTEAAKGIFSALVGCGYIDRRSVFRQARTQIALGMGRPDAAVDGEYRGWVIAPPARQEAKETPESRQKTEIDQLFEAGSKAVNSTK